MLTVLIYYSKTNSFVRGATRLFGYNFRNAVENKNSKDVFYSLKNKD